jgi:glutamine synthetase
MKLKRKIIRMLNFRKQKSIDINYLSKIINAINKNLKLTPIVGAELEFYFFGNSENLEKQILQQKIADSFEKERAKNQYEITFSETADILSLINRINTAKKFIIAFAKKNKVKASFKSYVKGQEVGSSLQFHISMLNENKQNVFAKVGDNESQFTIFAVGGLLHYMLSHFLLFASSKNSYKRFYEAVEAKCFTPLAVCWGADNRTAAIRIPQSTLNPQNRNIEHRVAGSDEPPEKVLYAILLAIYLGIKNKILAPEKVYGKAYEKQYQQAPYNSIMFPKNLKEAKKLFDNEIAFLQN